LLDGYRRAARGHREGALHERRAEREGIAAMARSLLRARSRRTLGAFVFPAIASEANTVRKQAGALAGGFRLSTELVLKGRVQARAFGTSAATKLSCSDVSDRFSSGPLIRGLRPRLTSARYGTRKKNQSGHCPTQISSHRRRLFESRHNRQSAHKRLSVQQRAASFLHEFLPS
jgi:hypothetical protein